MTAAGFLGDQVKHDYQLTKSKVEKVAGRGRGAGGGGGFKTTTTAGALVFDTK